MKTNLPLFALIMIKGLPDYMAELHQYVVNAMAATNIGSSSRVTGRVSRSIARYGLIRALRLRSFAATNVVIGENPPQGPPMNEPFERILSPFLGCM